MDLEAMRALVMTVQLGSVTAAARALHRSQPAVSARLRALEREVGEALLVRQARGVLATRAGERFCARAQDILRGVDEMQTEVQATGARLHGTLRIGATDVMAVYYLPQLLVRFRQKHPGIQLEMAVDASRPLAERVRSADLDLAFVTLPAEQPELIARELHRDRVIMLAAPDHRLASRRRVSLAELAAEPMIEHRRDSVTREMVDAVFRVQGLEPRVAMEVSSPAAMKELVALGLGIAPLSHSLVANELAEGKLVRLRAPDFRCFRRSGIVRRRQAVPQRAVSAFLALLPRTAGKP